MVAKTKKVFVEDSSQIKAAGVVTVKVAKATMKPSGDIPVTDKLKTKRTTQTGIPHSVGLGARVASNPKKVIFANQEKTVPNKKAQAKLALVEPDKIEFKTSQKDTPKKSKTSTHKKAGQIQSVSVLPKIKNVNTEVKLKVPSVAKVNTPHSIRLKVREKAGSRKIDVPIHNNTTTKISSVKAAETKEGSKNVLGEEKVKIPLLRFPSLPLIQSPFRFPLIVPTPKTLGLVARMSGVYLVVLGGIFSLINLHTISYSNSDQMSAIAITSLGGNEVIAPIGEGSGTSTPIESPTATFSVEGGNVLKDSAHIVVSVSNATNVTLTAYNLDERRLYSVGTARTIDATTWKSVWDTTRIPNGNYKLIATIQSTTGTHQTEDSKSITINNTTEEKSESTSSTTTADATAENAVVSSSEEVLTPPHVTLTLPNNDSMRGVVSLKAQAPGATGVRFYAQHEKSSLSHYLGVAKFVDTVWERSLDTRTLPNGTYTITAKASIDGTNYTDSESGVEISNPVVTTSSTSSVIINEEIASSLIPTATLTFSRQSPIYGYTSMNITTSPDVMWVELYAKKDNSLTSTFLGLAQKISTTEWKYIWQTAETPNGDYVVYARLKTQYGFTEDRPYKVSILNRTLDTLTKDQEEIIDVIHEAEETLVQVISDDSALESDTQVGDAVYIEEPKSFIDALEADENIKDILARSLVDFGDTLDTSLSILAEAKRTGDDALFTQTQKNIEDLKNSAIQDLGGHTLDTDIIEKVSQYLNEVTYKTQEVTLQNEKIIRERIGEAILKDSDNDSISDYDEVHLYRTNPFSGDTDSDGFIDSIEITRGFNPLNAETEALVAYESPREKGLVREDLLKVSDVSTLSPESASGTKAALIQGTALPNSFVTLYIFSTPIIVTIKTDSTGNWSYILDKELENGKHDVYIGVTDNEGHIVAKSSPFPFVKTAEAYVAEEGRSPEAITSRAEPSLVGGNSMLLVASIAVVALGLVLILIGFHVSPAMRREEFAVPS